MKYYLIAAVAVGIVLCSVALAQVPPGRNANGSAPQAGQPNGSAAQAAANVSNAASINGNPAVATSSANDVQPAKGANSFTKAEAKSRLERSGYANVSGLSKDDDGIWRGTATKGGKEQNVWLDFKGNTGTGK
jgi:hypothetical protein